MSGYIAGAVWNTRFPEKTIKFVLASLADNANDEGFAWPSVEAIQQRTQYSRRSVLSALERLVGDGYIVKMQSPRSFRHNAYQIVMEKLNFEKPKAPELSLKKRARQVQSTTIQVQPTTPLKPESGAICAESGAIHDASQVQSTAESGAIHDALYRGTVIEPSLNRQGESSEAKSPPSADLALRGQTTSLTLDAQAMFGRLGIVAPAVTISLAESAIRILASDLKCDPKMALMVIERTARSAIEAGETVNRFWFEDSKWKGVDAPNGKRADPTIGAFDPAELAAITKRIEERHAVPEDADLEAGARVWIGMSEAIKAQIGPQSWDTWIRPFRQAGVVDGVLYLKMPNELFANVPDRYEIAEYLPQGIADIRFLMAEGCAA